MRVNVLLTLVGPPLDEDVRAGFGLYAEWEILAEKSGRLLVDALGREADVATVFTALDYLGRDPRAIAAWREDGTLVDGYPFDLDAWLAVAPEGETTFRDLHGFQGWATKEIPHGT